MFRSNNSIISWKKSIKLLVKRLSEGMPKNPNYIEMLKLWYTYHNMNIESSSRLPLSSTNRTQRLPMIWCMFFCPKYFFVLYSIHTCTNDFFQICSQIDISHEKASSGIRRSPTADVDYRQRREESWRDLQLPPLITEWFYIVPFFFSFFLFFKTLYGINKVSNKTIIF